MKILSFPTSLGTLGKYDEVEHGPEFALKGIEHDIIKPVVSNQEDYLDQIHVEAKKHETLLSIGGDHSISYPLVFTFKEKYPEGKIVVLDAHPDCEVHTDTPTHEDWIRMLIESGVVRPEDVYFIGTRKITSREKKFMNENEIRVCEELPEFQVPVYLSIDIDVLDPSECEGFYFKEKDGMKITDLLQIIKSLKPKIKFADIVEIFPDKKTADIVKEIISILI